MTKACRRKSKPWDERLEADKMPLAVKYGDSITLDHFVTIKEEHESRHGHKMGVVCLDIATRWMRAYPSKDKTADSTKFALRHFMGQEEPKRVYSDNSLEIKKAIQTLKWSDRHDTSSTNNPRENGLVEQMMRVVKSGTRAVLLQSGFDQSWWTEAMEYFCFARCISTSS